MADDIASVHQPAACRIAREVRQLIVTQRPEVHPTEKLRDLLELTQARAVGCWRHRSGRLELAGFLATNLMPTSVQIEFCRATASVPLSQTQFGIVQAVVADGPALNHRAPSPADSSVGSIGWLGRFEAASSLAIPLKQQGQLAGALAVATTARIEPGDAVWNLVDEIVRQFAAED